MTPSSQPDSRESENADGDKSDAKTTPPAGKCAAASEPPDDPTVEIAAMDAIAAAADAAAELDIAIDVDGEVERASKVPPGPQHAPKS